MVAADDEPLLPLDWFVDPDPWETVTFRWSIPIATAINVTDKKEEEGQQLEQQSTIVQISVTGYKPELGQQLSSTGLTLWPASRLLCDYMVSNFQQVRAAESILELGAGLGLCGMLAAKLIATTGDAAAVSSPRRRIVLTDGDSNVLARLRSNVQANFATGGSSGDNGDPTNHALAKAQTPEVEQLLWGQSSEWVAKRGKFSLVLGADLCYYSKSSSLEALLWSTVDELLEDGGEFWLSYTNRNVSIDNVLSSGAQKGLVCSRRPPLTTTEGVYIFEKSDIGRIND